MVVDLISILIRWLEPIEREIITSYSLQNSFVISWQTSLDAKFITYSLENSLVAGYM